MKEGQISWLATSQNISNRKKERERDQSTYILCGLHLKRLLG
jgi:hypothetical protein